MISRLRLSFGERRIFSTLEIRPSCFSVNFMGYAHLVLDISFAHFFLHRIHISICDRWYFPSSDQGFSIKSLIFIRLCGARSPRIMNRFPKCWVFSNLLPTERTMAEVFLCVSNFETVSHAAKVPYKTKI